MLWRMDKIVEKRRRGRPRAFNQPAEPNAVQSLDRALRILAIVADADGLSLSEVAERSDLAASTAYRMLTTLANHGMVEFDEAGAAVVDRRRGLPHRLRVPEEPQAGRPRPRRSCRS